METTLKKLLGKTGKQWANLLRMEAQKVARHQLSQAGGTMMHPCCVVIGQRVKRLLVVNRRLYLTIKKKKTLFTYLKRGEGREKERERNINVWLPLTRLPTGDLARNPGMYPDWESNQWPFGSYASTQFIEPHQPGPVPNDFMYISRMVSMLSVYSGHWPLLTKHKLKRDSWAKEWLVHTEAKFRGNRGTRTS